MTTYGCDTCKKRGRCEFEAKFRKFDYLEGEGKLEEVAIAEAFDDGPMPDCGRVCDVPGCGQTVMFRGVEHRLMGMEEFVNHMGERMAASLEVAYAEEEKMPTGPMPRDLFDADEELKGELRGIGFKVPCIERPGEAFVRGGFLIRPKEFYFEVEMLLTANELLKELTARSKKLTPRYRGFNAINVEGDVGSGLALMPPDMLKTFASHALGIKRELTFNLGRIAGHLRAVDAGVLEQDSVVDFVREAESIVSGIEASPSVWLAKTLAARPKFSTATISKCFLAVVENLEEQQRRRGNAIRVLRRAITKLRDVVLRLMFHLPEELRDVEKPPARRVALELVDETLECSNVIGGLRLTPKAITEAIGDSKALRLLAGAFGLGAEDDPGLIFEAVMREKQRMMNLTSLVCGSTSTSSDEVVAGVRGHLAAHEMNLAELRAILGSEEDTVTSLVDAAWAARENALVLSALLDRYTPALAADEKVVRRSVRRKSRA